MYKTRLSKGFRDFLVNVNAGLIDCEITSLNWVHVCIDGRSVESRYNNEPFKTIYTPSQQALDALRNRFDRTSL